MTYLESKKEILALIEEYSPNVDTKTDDEDISLRIPFLFNLAYQELAQSKKIIATKTYPEADKKEDKYTQYMLPSDLYQIKNVFLLDNANKKCNSKYFIVGKNKIYISDLNEGSTILEYYKYPTVINDETEDDFYLELDQDALSVLPYKVADDILKTDPSANYTAFSSEYQRKLQILDNRRSIPTVNIVNDEVYENSDIF